VNGSNNLQRIVRNNEDIKNVVRLAHRINLLALNAMLLSRRAGEGAAGFGVIATELRIFVRSLMEVMQTLLQRSQGSVDAVSRARRVQRIEVLMSRAHDNIRRIGGTPHGRDQFSRAQEQRAALVAAFAELDHLLDDADEATRFGCVIARGLKIEAVYGGELCDLLTQVALDFSEHIDAIPAMLHQIKQHVHVLAHR